MTPDFQRVRRGNSEQLLRFMAELYEHERIAWRDAETRRAVEELLGSEQYGGAWFIDLDAEAVGYMVLTLAFSLEFGGKFVLLDELYIRDAWTGKGIGRDALRFAEQQSASMGAYALRLEAGRENERALTFYERHGFRAEERYLMTKRLR